MRVCLAGCGVAMPLQMLGIEGIEEAQVAAVCDRDIDKAKAAAVGHGIQEIYADLDEMLEKERPDAVHVMTPPRTHRDIGLRALEAGGPPPVSGEEGREVIRVHELLCRGKVQTADPIEVRS